MATSPQTPRASGPRILPGSTWPGIGTSQPPHDLPTTVERMESIVLEHDGDDDVPTVMVDKAHDEAFEVAWEGVETASIDPVAVVQAEMGRAQTVLAAPAARATPQVATMIAPPPGEPASSEQVASRASASTVVVSPPAQASTIVVAPRTQASTVVMPFPASRLAERAPMLHVDVPVDLPAPPVTQTTKPGRTRRIAKGTLRTLWWSAVTAIVLAAIGYAGMLAFYGRDDHWMTPLAVSPHDEHVLALEGELATRTGERARLAHELARAEGTIASEQTFQLDFAKALHDDLEGRQAALGKVRLLAHRASATRVALDALDALDATGQAELTSSNEALEAELRRRSAELAVQTKALDGMLAQQAAASKLDYDMVKVQRDYEESKRELANTIELRTKLVASLATQDRTIAQLQQSPYLRALADHAALVLAPATRDIGKGEPVFACRFEMIGCRRVGTVLEVLPGDFEATPPHRTRHVRAHVIELRLDDAAGSDADVLFVGKKPLGL